VDKYGKGGYRIVKTKGERDSIKTSLRVLGMMVYVSDPACDTTFRLVQNPDYPDDISKALWRYWLPVANRATYYMTKTGHTDDYWKNLYPFVAVRTPIYYREPFPDNLYYIRVQCYNDRGMVPYLIVQQTPQYFSLDVSEPCICSWEANTIN
jgi:hypothetical protein